MMSRRPNTPPKRRLSVSDSEQQEKRPRSTDSREGGDASVTGRRRGSSPPAHDSGKQQQPNPRLVTEDRGPSHRNSNSSSASPGSSATGESSSRPVPAASLGPRPTWRTDSSAASNVDPHTSDRHLEPRSLPEMRDRRKPANPPPPMRSASQPQPGPATRSPLVSVHGIVLGQNKQAAFVNKLYQMLEDPNVTRSGLLEWAHDGKSFICNNPAEFAREVLPNFFKHNNWQSFVRQLNMYSFNKVSDLYSTANVDPTAWEFRHPLFQRGEPGLLPRIKRKSNRSTRQESATPSPGEEEQRPTGWASRPHSSQGPGAPNGFYAPPHPDDAAYQHYYVRGQSRPVSSGYGSVKSPSESPLAHPTMLGGVRSRSGHQVPQAGPSHPGHSPRSEPTYYSTRTPSLETVSNQVTTLQDTVHRLWSILNLERQRNARTNLELSAYLIRVTDWLSDSDGLRVPRQVLEGQRVDLLRRYEAIRDSELLNVPEEHPPPSSRSNQPPHDSRSFYQAVARPATTGSFSSAQQPRQTGPYGDISYRVPDTSARETHDSRETPRAFLHDSPYEYSRHLPRPSPSRRLTEPHALESEPPVAAEEPPKASLRNILH